MTKLFDINEAVCINLLDNLPGMFFRCLNDFRRTMLYASVGSKNLTGYSPEDFMGSEGVSYGLLLHNQDRERVSFSWFDCVAKKEACNIEYRIICREGRVRWVREFSNGIYDDKGNLKYIEGYIQEITAEKNSRLLTNAFTSYQKAINRGSIVSITDKAGYILYVNDLFCTYSKYSREELTGHNHNIINSGFHPP
jgi:PAS domain S-box-containing protein